MHRMLFDRARCLFGSARVASVQAAEPPHAISAQAASSPRIRCVDAAALAMRDGAAGG
jgi:hypothetical protein